MTLVFLWRWDLVMGILLCAHGTLDMAHWSLWLYVAGPPSPHVIGQRVRHLITTRLGHDLTTIGHSHYLGTVMKRWPIDTLPTEKSNDSLNMQRPRRYVFLETVTTAGEKERKKEKERWLSIYLSLDTKGTIETRTARGRGGMKWGKSRREEYGTKSQKYERGSGVGVGWDVAC